MGIFGKFLLTSLAVLCCIGYKCAAQLSQFHLPGRPLMADPGLQVDSEGRVFVTAGNQLLRLNNELVLEQNVSFASTAVNISISTDGERLMMCTADLSCVVYNTGDLSVQPIDTGIHLLSADSVALFSTEGSFYVGSYISLMGNSVQGRIRLSQYIYGDGTNSAIRTSDYIVGTSLFTRNFLSGFVSGDFAYFLVYDTNAFQEMRVMRVCHATGCPGNVASCGFTALYEEDIRCGGTLSVLGDGTCGASVVEDFGGRPGTSMILSRCRHGSMFSNIVCSFNLSSVDSTMDMRYDGCKASTIQQTKVAWVGMPSPCSGVNFTSRCDFSQPLDSVIFDRADRPVLEEIRGTDIVDIGSGNGDITVSLALIVDGISLVVAGYSRNSRTSHFIGFFRVTGTLVNLASVFNERNFSSSAQSLQWQSGLDYVMVASLSQVVRIPLEECSSSEDCSSCVGSTNPLCGWCVVEDKCSRVSKCRDGNSTSSTRWIRTNPSESNSNLCIVNSVTPKQFVLDNQEVLSVAVGGPGLPDLLPDESYSCHLADSEGRFNITVPALEVNPGTNYTCNITDRVPSYPGIRAEINFSFVSSRANLSFDTTKTAMTIYRCSATSRCSDCLQTANVCGWCVVNKLCRGTATDCTNSINNFLQLGGGQMFQDVCPLLDLKDRISNYTLPFRVDTSLRLTTRNLPPMVSGFSYMCFIGRTSVMATRIDDTAITCQVNSDQLTINGPIEVAVLNIIWSNSADINHAIDMNSPVTVTVYNCQVLGADCSSCISTRDNSEFLCGWCDSTPPQCSVSEGCTSSPFLINGIQCLTPTISSISPTSGPPEGGTVITITGTDLGVSFVDFNSPSGIFINNIACAPLNRDYISGRRVLCKTGATATGSYPVVVRFLRNTGIASAMSSLFKVVAAKLFIMEPTFGPLAGGSVLTINGTNLNIGNSATVRVNGNSGPECSDVSRLATRITCTTPNVTSTSEAPGLVVVQIDNQIISDPAIQFRYRNNPHYTSIQPLFTIPSGGVTITFTGTDLDVANSPQLIFNGVARSPCSILHSTTLICVAPAVNAITGMFSYELRLDSAPPPDLTNPSLQLSVKPDPVVNAILPQLLEASFFSTVIQIYVNVSIGLYLMFPFPRSIVILGKNEGEMLSGTIALSVLVPIVILLGFATVITAIIIYVCVKRKQQAVAKRLELKLTNDNLSAKIIPDNLLEALLEQLPAHLIISNDELRMLDIPLGEGQFGIVYKAHLLRHDAQGRLQTSPVAVKIMKGAFSYSDIESVFSEILKMQDFSHSNVMTLVGVCIDVASGPSIIMPYMTNGSLLNYLKRERSNLFLDSDSDEDTVISVRKLLLKMCHQISLGMAYLSCNQIVHRDLAARNCLLGSEGNIKVSDFGLSVDVYTTGYFRQNRKYAVKLPFKWMAPESLTDTIFTVKSDVWSFGVTCWEVFSAGRSPYPGVDAIDLPKLLDEGMRLDYPTNAANASEIYVIIKKCWRQSPKDRPSFDELSLMFESRLLAMSDYLELKMVLEEPEEPSANTRETKTYEVRVVNNPLKFGTGSEYSVIPDHTSCSTGKGGQSKSMEKEIMVISA